MYYMYTRVALSWSVNWSSSNILCTKPAQHYNTCSTANKIWVFGIRRPAINQNEPNKSLCSNIFTNRLSALDSNQTNNSKNPTNSYHSLSKTNRTAPITPPTKINLSNHPPLIIFRYTTSPPCGLFLMPRWFEKKKLTDGRESTAVPALRCQAEWNHSKSAAPRIPCLPPIWKWTCKKEKQLPGYENNQSHSFKRQHHYSSIALSWLTNIICRYPQKEHTSALN